MSKYFAWNEGDSNGNDKNKKNDPWGKNNREPDNDGLPDLDEIFSNWAKKIKQLLGGQSKNVFGGGGSNSSMDNQGGALFGMSVFILAIIIGVMGFYKVEPGENAVEYRFGKYIGTQGPGPHWIFPIIYSKEIYNTNVVHQAKFNDNLITKEVNIVSVELAVQYKIGNLENYLFKVRSAEKSLSEATTAAIRQIIAESTLDEVLSTSGKSKDSYLGGQIKDIIEQNLELYQAGLEIHGVEVLPVLPPEQVREAFNDAIQAQEDEIRYQNEADAYVSKVLPVAEGKAARIIQEANAYVAQIVFAAEGGVARFNALLPEYKRAPNVTRNRLYISTIESVLTNTPKVMIDSKSNNALLVLSDKMKMNDVLGGALDSKSRIKKSLQDIDRHNISESSIIDGIKNKKQQPQPQITRSWRD